MELPYGMYDSDHHLYEKADAFTRFLPPSRRDDMFWVTDERGHRHYIINGKWWNYIPNPTWDPISIPGSMSEMFAGKMSATEVDVFKVVEPLSNHPEYQDSELRIKKLREQNVEGVIMFPTNVTGLETATLGNPELALDMVWAYNQWLAEDWGFCKDNRMFTSVIISLADVNEAVRILEWAIGLGAKAIQVRPGPVATPSGFKSPGDPMFDPFWARVEEAGILACSHVADSGYERYSGDYTGRYFFKALRRNPLEQILIHGRPIMDYLSALICHGVFARFPNLKVLSIENGCDWVPYLQTQLKTFYSRYSNSFPQNPMEAWHKNVWVSPFWEEDIKELSQYCSIDHILAGSDFPHAEGILEPTDYAKGLQDFSEADQKKILHSNLKGLFATANA